MTAAEDLLLRILGDPNEDLPRLMYADEIEEANPARAEFIRVQYEWALLAQIVMNGIFAPGPPSNAPDTSKEFSRVVCELKKRERHLWSNRRDNWAFPFVGALDWFHRGFVQHFKGRAEDWIKGGDRLLSAHPVQDVTLTTMPDIRCQITREPYPMPRMICIQGYAAWGDKHVWQQKIVDQLAYERGSIDLIAQAEEEVRRCADPITFFKTAWPTVKTWHPLPEYPR